LPGLSQKLKMAAIKETPQEFIKSVVFTSFYMTTGFLIILAAILSKISINKILLIIAFPVLFVIVFLYFVNMPDVKIVSKRKSIDREIIYAGRFLVVELQSGVLLYNAMKNVSKSYKDIGNAFGEIIHAIDLGTSIEDALRESIEYTPSNDFRRMLWQIMNALKTGSDVSDSLKSVLDQITREQIIEVQSYSKKLNPLAMFYMILAVILPSLGITMLVVMSSFVSIELTLGILLGISAVLGLLQFMFFTIIKSSRPAVSV